MNSESGPLKTLAEKYYKLSNGELQKLCKEHKLKVSGNKQALVERLIEYQRRPVAKAKAVQAHYIGKDLLSRSPLPPTMSSHVPGDGGGKGGEFAEGGRSGLPPIKAPSCPASVSKEVYPLLVDAFRLMDPLLPAAEVDRPVLKLDVLNTKRLRFGMDFNLLRLWRRQGLSLHLRCIHMKKMGLLSQGKRPPDLSPLHSRALQNVWPHTLTCYINGRSEVTVDPPKHLKKRRDEPKELTSLLKPSENLLEITVEDNFEARSSEFAVALVLCSRKRTADLIRKIPKLDSDVCKERAIRILMPRKGGEGEEELEEASDPVVRLVCPLSLDRITRPARGDLCAHLQCFDAMSYLSSQESMSAFNNRWHCPFCNRVLRPENLVIDSFFQEILDDPATAESEEVRLEADTAEWTPLAPPTFSDSDDDEDGDTGNADSTGRSRDPSAPPQRIVQKKIEVVTLESSDDDEEQAPSKRQASSLPAPSAEEGTRPTSPDRGEDPRGRGASSLYPGQRSLSSQTTSAGSNLPHAIVMPEVQPTSETRRAPGPVSRYHLQTSEHTHSNSRPGYASLPWPNNGGQGGGGNFTSVSAFFHPPPVDPSQHAYLPWSSGWADRPEGYCPSEERGGGGRGGGPGYVTLPYRAQHSSLSDVYGPQSWRGERESRGGSERASTPPPAPSRRPIDHPSKRRKVDPPLRQASSSRPGRMGKSSPDVIDLCDSESD